MISSPISPWRAPARPTWLSPPSSPCVLRLPIRRRSMASDGVATQGPLFNMLVGLGVAFFVQCSATGKPVVVGPHTGVEKSTWNALHVSFIGLSAILCATCVAGGLSKFRLHRWWIFALLGYYGVYMIVEAVIALLAE